MSTSLDEALARSEELVKKAEKPGFMTSEFWLAASTTAIGLLVKLSVIGSETSPVAQAVSSVMIVAGPVVYILARSGIKKGFAEVLAYLTAELNKQNK